MKIYVNPNKFPPTLNASTSAKTDSAGVLKVYSSTLGSEVSSIALKRGTNVPVSVVFPNDIESAPTTVRFGVKAAGKFDGLLVLAAESSAPTTLDDGSVRFDLLLNVAADEIDQALGVGIADDVAKADYHAEIEWEDAAGHTTASETVSVEIQNNIVRASSDVSGTNIPGNWTSLMFVEISWADYIALREYPEYVRYVIPDAPSEVEQHNADPGAHGGQFLTAEDAGIIRGQISEHTATLDAIEAGLFVDSVPAAGTQNANAYGYCGTLRQLGAFGGTVPVIKLSIWTRSSGAIQNGGVAVWARILKNVGGAWVIVAQSESPAVWNDYGVNAEIPFKMIPAAGVVPPSADEKIAIVFVNNASAAAAASYGLLGFRVAPGSGGFSAALSANANAAAGNATWMPRIKLRFAPLAGTTQYATAENLAALETRIATLEAAIAAEEELTENGD